MTSPKREDCPACGGAGGGPFGPANSGWDIESYECPRCEGWGYIREATVEDDAPRIAGPGVVRTSPSRVERVGETAVPKGGRRAG
jgi:hypothetical protein